MTTLALAVRMLGLRDLALWNDEAFSWAISRGSLDELLAHLRRDFHPPGYYALLWLWMQWAGDGLAALRWLSILLGTASILLILSALRPWMPGPALALSGVLLALHPTHALWSFTVRGYALLGLTFAAAVWGASRWLQTTSVTPPLAGSRSWATPAASALALAVCAGGCLASAFVHNTGLVAWGVLVVGLIFATARRSPGRLVGLAVAHGAAALLYLPWAAALVQQSRVMRSATPSHYAAVDASALLETLFEWFFMSHIHTARLWVVLVVLCLLIVGIMRGWKHPLIRALSVVLGLIWVLGLVGVYLLERPLMAYVLQTSRWAHLIVVPMVALGIILGPWGRRGIWIVAALAVAVSALGTRNLLLASRVDWPGVVTQSLLPEPARHHMAASELSWWAPLYELHRRGLSVDLWRPSWPESWARDTSPMDIVLFSNGPQDASRLDADAELQRRGWRIESIHCSRGACAHRYASP